MGIEVLGHAPDDDELTELALDADNDETEELLRLLEELLPDELTLLDDDELTEPLLEELELLRLDELDDPLLEELTELVLMEELTEKLGLLTLD